MNSNSRLDQKKQKTKQKIFNFYTTLDELKVSGCTEYHESAEKAENPCC